MKVEPSSTSSMPSDSVDVNETVLGRMIMKGCMQRDMNTKHLQTLPYVKRGALYLDLALDRSVLSSRPEEALLELRVVSVVFPKQVSILNTLFRTSL